MKTFLCDRVSDGNRTGELDMNQEDVSFNMALNATN